MTPETGLQRPVAAHLLHPGSLLHRRSEAVLGAEQAPEHVHRIGASAPPPPTGGRHRQTPGYGPPGGSTNLSVTDTAASTAITDPRETGMDEHTRDALVAPSSTLADWRRTVQQLLNRRARTAPTTELGRHTEAPTPAAKTERRSFLQLVRDTALWLRDSGLAVVGYLGVLVVCGYGWRTSFIGLHTFAMAHMGLSDDDAWGVPITFDGGAGVLTLVVARAAMNGRGAVVWRLGVLALTLLSSWINWVHIVDPDGRRIAALLPIVAVGAFEGLLSEARKAYERRTGNVRPRLSLLRWAFDFIGTFRILRAYVLGIPLPDQMVAAAETVQAEPAAVKTKRQRRRSQPAKAKKVETKPAPDPAEPSEPREDADVIDLNQHQERPVWLTDELKAVAKKAMFAYLDRHPNANGAELDRFGERWLGTSKNYGRGVRREWLVERPEVPDGDPVAAGGQ